MVPYITIIIISVLLTRLDAVQLRKYDKLWFFVPFMLVLTLFVSLRPPAIDRDYVAYQTAYGYMQYFDWKDMLYAYSIYQLEWGYVFLTKLFYSLGFSFAAFLFVYEFLLGVLMARLFYKYSPYFFTSLCMYVCLFFFLRNFTQIRFAFASILLVYGLFQCAEKKMWTGLLCMIGGGLIHNAAWIGLFVPLCYLIFFNRWIYLIFPVLGIFVSLLHPIQLIASLVGLPGQITRYFTAPTEVGSSLMSYVFSYALLIISVLHYDKLKELFGRKFEYIYIALSISIFIGLAFIEFPIMQRISNALFTISIFLVPYLMKLLSEKRWYGYRDLFAFGVILVFFVYGAKLILVSHLLKPYF